VKKLALVLVLGLVACGKDHMTSESMQRPAEPVVPAVEPVTSTPKLDAGCAAVAKATCAALARCSPNSTSLAWAPGECEPSIMRECTLIFAVPGSGVTDAFLHKCAAWSATQCPLFRDAGECKPPPGRFADRAACSISTQCQSEHCEKASYKDACGVCGRKPPGERRHATGPQLGKACTDSCGDNLHCDKGKCIAPKPRVAGESCTRSFLGFADGPQPCGPGLWCVGDKQPTCMKRPGDGEACRSDGAICYAPASCRDGKCVLPDHSVCK
jgi:hypothetical protein